MLVKNSIGGCKNLLYFVGYYSDIINLGFCGGLQLQTAVLSHFELDPVLSQEPPPKTEIIFPLDSLPSLLSKSANNNFFSRFFIIKLFLIFPTLIAFRIPLFLIKIFTSQFLNKIICVFIFFKIESLKINFQEKHAKIDKFWLKTSCQFILIN